MKSSYWSTWKPNLSFLACRTVRTLKINKLLQAYDINSMPLVYVIPEKHSKCDESKCGTHWRSNWARRSTLALWINIHFRRLITDFELLRTITDYNSLSFYRLSSQTTDVLRSPISPQDETGLSFLSLNETNRVKCEVYKHNWKGKNIKCNFSWIRNDNLFNNNFLNNMLLNATHIKLCISEFIQINIKIYIKN